MQFYRTLNVQDLFYANFAWVLVQFKRPLAVMWVAGEWDTGCTAAMKVAERERQGNKGTFTNWEWVLLVLFLSFLNPGEWCEAVACLLYSASGTIFSFLSFLHWIVKWGLLSEA